MRPETGGRKEKKQREYHRLSNVVGLRSDNLSHKMRNVFTHHSKIKSCHKKLYPPNDDHSDLKH